MFITNSLWLTLVAIGVQLPVWAISSYLQTEKYYDLTGETTFVLILALSMQWTSKWTSTRCLVQGSLITFWALRLGFHLFSRIETMGKDRRFDAARERPALFLVFWIMQGIWVIVTLLPTLVLHNDRSETTRPIAAREYIGWAVWILGLAIEWIADRQKMAFILNPENKGVFINEGLWARSRHPNYFGEILLWTGLAIAASGSAKNVWHYVMIATGPTFVAFLLTFVSGIPLLEAHALKKWGGREDYQQYLQDVPVLLPRIF